MKISEFKKLVAELKDNDDGEVWIMLGERLGAPLSAVRQSEKGVNSVVMAPLYCVEVAECMIHLKQEERIAKAKELGWKIEEDNNVTPGIPRLAFINPDGVLKEKESWNYFSTSVANRTKLLDDMGIPKL